MSAKYKHCSNFIKLPYKIYGDIEMDPELIGFMEEVNKSPHIVTTNSCIGHDVYTQRGKEYDFISNP